MNRVGARYDLLTEVVERPKETRIEKIKKKALLYTGSILFSGLVVGSFYLASKGEPATGIIFGTIGIIVNIAFTHFNP